MLQTHTDERPFSCAYCNFTSKQNGNLRMHVRRKHPNKPVPSSKRTSTPHHPPGAPNLTRRRPSRPSTALRPTCKKAFKCDECEEEFVREDSLRSHQRFHRQQERWQHPQSEEGVLQTADFYPEESPQQNTSQEEPSEPELPPQDLVDEMVKRERELRAKLIKEDLPKPSPQTSQTVQAAQAQSPEAKKTKQQEDEEASLRRSRRRQAASNLLALKQNSLNLAVEENMLNAARAAAAAATSRQRQPAETDAAQTLTSNFLGGAPSQEHSYHMRQPQAQLQTGTNDQTHTQTQHTQIRAQPHMQSQSVQNQPQPLPHSHTQIQGTSTFSTLETMATTITKSMATDASPHANAGNLGGGEYQQQQSDGQVGLFQPQGTERQAFQQSTSNREFFQGQDEAIFQQQDAQIFQQQQRDEQVLYQQEQTSKQILDQQQQQQSQQQMFKQQQQQQQLFEQQQQQQESPQASMFHQPSTINEEARTIFQQQDRSKDHEEERGEGQEGALSLLQQWPYTTSTTSLKQSDLRMLFSPFHQQQHQQQV